MRYLLIDVEGSITSITESDFQKIEKKGFLSVVSDSLNIVDTEKGVVYRTDYHGKKLIVDKIKKETWSEFDFNL